jgi:hypothetical protein
VFAFDEIYEFMIDVSIGHGATASQRTDGNDGNDEKPVSCCPVATR